MYAGKSLFFLSHYLEKLIWEGYHAVPTQRQTTQRTHRGWCVCVCVGVFVCVCMCMCVTKQERGLIRLPEGLEPR